MNQRYIFLVRHGQIPETQARRFIGQKDLPLAQKGRLQMNQVANLMQHRAVSAIYASPLQRAMDSAVIIADRLDLTVQTVLNLSEINLGQWDGLSIKEVKRRFPAEYKKRGQNLAIYKTPGGESFKELQGRCIAALNSIVQDKCGNILIVAHAGVNRVLLCHFMGLDLANLFEIKQDYACTNLITVKNSDYHILFTNRSSRQRL